MYVKHKEHANVVYITCKNILQRLLQVSDID